MNEMDFAFWILMLCSVVYGANDKFFQQIVFALLAAGVLIAERIAQ